jgi:hypothetical protein
VFNFALGLGYCSSLSLPLHNIQRLGSALQQLHSNTKSTNGKTLVCGFYGLIHIPGAEKLPLLTPNLHILWGFPRIIPKPLFVDETYASPYPAHYLQVA